jgi:hypothetical protein
MSASASAKSEAGSFSLTAVVEQFDKVKKEVRRTSLDNFLIRDYL